ncbi:MAG: type II secretion system protein [Verrucomicrobium sp.]
MKNTTLKNSIAKGFSLIEMLVVIAVIGVIAAIAIPSISGIGDAADKGKNQRNAQNIISVYQAGVAAGAAWGEPADAEDVVKKVAAGTKVTGGAFDGKAFQVPGITEAADVTATAKYIAKDTTTGQWSYIKDAK